MTGPRVVTLPSGERLAAGLAWQVPHARADARALGREAASGQPELVLRRGDRRARLPASSGAEGAGALAVALGAALAKDAPAEGLWLFAAELPGDGEAAALHWIGSAEAGRAAADGGGREAVRIRPSPGPEELHGGREEFLAAIAGIAATSAVAGAVVADLGAAGAPDASLRDAVRAALAGEAGGAEGGAPPVLLRAPIPGGPVFERRRGIAPRTLALAAAGATAAGALALAVAPLAASLARSAPPPPIETVRAVPAPGAFAAACTDALADWWPRVAGWRPAGRGCALPGHLDGLGPTGSADGIGQAEIPLLAWRRFERAPDANPVLAAGAAGRVLDAWPHGWRRSDAELLLWQARGVRLAPDDGSAARADPAAARAELAALWARFPGAVSEAGGGGFAVSVPGGAASLLARAERVPGLAPVRIDLPETAPARLLLRPVEGRIVPAETLAETAGGPAPATTEEGASR